MINHWRAVQAAALRSYPAYRPPAPGGLWAPASSQHVSPVFLLSALLLAGLDDWHRGGLFLVLIGSWPRVGSHVTFSFSF